MTHPPTHDDGDLRRLMDDAVSDVHPEGGLEQIHARTRRPSATRWVPITLAAAAATAVVIAGGAWLAQQQPASNPPAAGPGPTEAPASRAPAGRTVETTPYYVGATAAGPRLFPEVHRVTDATGSDLQVAVDEALRDDAKDPDYSPALPPGTTAVATTDGQQVTLDLNVTGDVSVLDRDAAQLAVQALVWTVDEAVGSDLPVRILLDGEPADDLSGIDVSQPVQKASADSVLSPVLVESPAQGATVPTTFTVTGRAATFEANVVWELERGGDTVRNGFTTAQECCTLSPFSFEVTAPPGEYTLVVHDTDESGGEGVGVSQDTKRITVE